MTLQKCMDIINTFKERKSPGTDGFEKRILCCIFERNLQACSGQLNYRVVITLLPKKDKNKNNLKNWRPIPLLSFDYNMLASKTIGKENQNFFT